MSPSPPFVASRRVQKQLLRWVVETKELIGELEGSGLVVNQSEAPPETPADVLERSHLIAGASLELTHGMLVLMGVLCGLPMPPPLSAEVPDVP